MACVELTEVFRQSDPESIWLLNRIWGSLNIEETVERLNIACFCQSDHVSDRVTLFCTKDRANRINDSKLRRLPGEERVVFPQAASAA